MTTRVDTLEPLPAPDPERPPGRKLSPSEWLRENLFGSPLDTVLTVLFVVLLAWVAYRVGRFVFFDARWEIVERNITNLMVGSFPRDQLSDDLRNAVSLPHPATGRDICSTRFSGSPPQPPWL